MTRSEAVNLERAVGRLEAQIEEYGKQIADLTSFIREENQTASEGRARLYDKIDKQSETMAAIDGRLSKAEGVLTEIAPLAREFGTFRERSRGFVFAMVLAWTLFGGLLMWIGGIAWDWLLARLFG